MAEQTSSNGGAGGFRALTARHPLAVFVALVLGFGWAILSLMVLDARGILSLGGLPPAIFVLIVNLGVMLPAALWVTAAVDGRAGVRAFLGRAARWRFGPIWWAVVLLALPALTIAAALLLGGSFKEGDLATVVAKQVGSMLVAVVLINLWEETVWGGFLQTRLERAYPFFVAAALTALPFAGVHIPLLLMSESLTPASFLLDLGGLVVLAVVARTMWGVVLRGARDSTLAIGLMHGIFNASNNRGQLVDSLLVNADVNTAAMIALGVLTVVLVVVNRRKLLHSKRPLIGTPV